MNPNRFYMLPDGVVILGGKEPFSRLTEKDKLMVDIADFDFVTYDPKSGETRVYNGGQETQYRERYVFVPNQAGCLHFKIESDLEHLALVDAVVSQAIKDLDVDKAEVEISFSEIIGNAFRVAGERSTIKDVTIGVLYVPEKKLLLISVTDELGRLNLDALPKSFSDDDGNVSLSDHGRGLLIISQLMDMIAYNQSNNAFKEVLIKVPFACASQDGETNEATTA